MTDRQRLAELEAAEWRRQVAKINRDGTIAVITTLVWWALILAMPVWEIVRIWNDSP